MAAFTRPASRLTRCCLLLASTARMSLCGCSSCFLQHLSAQRQHQIVFVLRPSSLCPVVGVLCRVLSGGRLRCATWTPESPAPSKAALLAGPETPTQYVSPAPLRLLALRMVSNLSSRIAGRHLRANER